MQANECPTVWQLLILRCFIIRSCEGLASQERVREDSVCCNISLPAAQSKFSRRGLEAPGERVCASDNVDH